MRYTLDGMLPERAFKKKLFSNSPATLEGGGGGQQQSSSQPSQQTITSNPIAEWAQPTATALIGSSMSNAFNMDKDGNILSSRGFTPFGGAVNAQGQFTGSPIGQEQYNKQLDVARLGVAGPSALQEQSYKGAANLQMPGQYGTATDFATQAGQGALGTTGQAGMYGAQGNMAAQQAARQSMGYGGAGAMAGLGAAGQSSMYGGLGAQSGQQYAGMSAGAGQQGSDIGQQYAGQSGMYGGLGAMQGQQGADIGQSLGQMSTNANAQQAYMNPYLQNALQPQLAEMERQYGITGTQQASQATQSGAFGGGRDAIMAAENARNKNTAMNQAIGQGYNTAFQNAQQQMNAANQAALAGNAQAMQGYGMGLQGAGQAGQQALAGNQQALSGYGQAGQQALAGYGMGLQGAGQAGSQAMQGFGMGLQGAGQAGQLGISGAQAGLQGVGAQQAGYGQAGQAGANLSNIGGQQLQAQQGILSTQNQMGAQQQQNQQNIINQALQNYSNQQQYPQQQTANIMNLLRSTPTTQTQTQYAPPPSALSQTAGLAGTALAGYKLAGASGGLPKDFEVKRMAGGGIASGVPPGKLQSMLADLSDQQLAQKANPKASDLDTLAAVQGEQAFRANARAGMPSNPGFAPGGIVAFAEGDRVRGKEAYAGEKEDDELINNILMSGMSQGMMPNFVNPQEYTSPPVGNAQAQPQQSSPKSSGSTFEKAMQFVLPHEGGFVNHPNDRGGATNKGVTQKTLSGYLGRPATIEDVKKLDTDTARDVYKKLFFDPIASKVQDPRAQMVAFNAAIASGPGYANKLIEKHKGDPYGMLNEHTKFMVNDIPKNDPSQKVFVKGWGNRQRDLGDYISKFAGGGEVKHFDGKDGSEVKDLYPNASRDKEFYEGLASLPSYVNAFNFPGKAADVVRRNMPDIVEGVKNTPSWWNATPQQQAQRDFPELMERKRQEKLEKEKNERIKKAGEMTDDEYAKYTAMNKSSGENRFIENQMDKKFNKEQTFANESSVNPIVKPVVSANNTGIASVIKNQPSASEMGPPKDLMDSTQMATTEPKKDTYSSIMDMLQGQQKQIGEQREQDKWLALLQGSLGTMAGTSPYALQNIGAGGAKGITEYAAAKKQRGAEQSDILSQMIGLQKVKGVEDYQKNQLMQSAMLRRDEIDARLQVANLNSQDRKDLLAERKRYNDIVDQNQDIAQKERTEARQDKNKQFNMSILERMQKDAQTRALADLKLNPLSLTGKSAEEIQAITAPKIQEYLNIPRYRELHKNTYGYDPYENTSSQSGNKELDLNKYLKK